MPPASTSSVFGIPEISTGPSTPPGGAIYLQPYGSPQGVNIYVSLVSMQIWFDSRPGYIPDPVNVHYDEALRDLQSGGRGPLDFWEEI